MQRLLYIILSILLSTAAFAQMGGSNTYEFLDITNSARVAALGGNQVGLVDDSDPNLVYHNPATLSHSMHQSMVANYMNYFSDINIGYFSYAHSLGEYKGTLSGAIHYLDYGEFTETDENGNKIGTFSASDYAFNFVYARALNPRFNVGVDLKPILSIYESYTSFGLVADVGLTYRDSIGHFTAGITFKNMGGQIVTYYPGAEREPMPFDIQIGVSKRLAHAPFRFSATMQYLTTWKLTDKGVWDYENSDDEDAQVEESGFGDQLMRHMVFGVEFLPSKNFAINLGYNYQRRKEMVQDNFTGLIGFSGGVRVKVSKFQFAYGAACYHQSGISNLFSLSTSIQEFK